MRRYERRSGELVHVDIKKLGRFWALGEAHPRPEVGNRSPRAGWQYLPVAIDDHSRLAYTEAPQKRVAQRLYDLPPRRSPLVSRARDHLERILSDNRNGYRSGLWRATCAKLGLARRYTRPRWPQTNGKADALVKTLQREWAYRFAYRSSARAAHERFPATSALQQAPTAQLARWSTSDQPCLRDLWVPHLASSVPMNVC